MRLLRIGECTANTSAQRAAWKWRTAPKAEATGQVRQGLVPQVRHSGPEAKHGLEYQLRYAVCDSMGHPPFSFQS